MALAFYLNLSANVATKNEIRYFRRAKGSNETTFLCPEVFAAFPALAYRFLDKSV